MLGTYSMETSGPKTGTPIIDISGPNRVAQIIKLLEPKPVIYLWKFQVDYNGTQMIKYSGPHKPSY